MNRLKEIEARMRQLREMLRGEGEVDLDAIEAEITALEEERSELMRRQQLQERAVSGMTTGLTFVEGSEGEEQTHRSQGFAEPEGYRSAWAHYMMRAAMSDEETRIFTETNDHYRAAFTHTTDNSSVLVPKTVSDGIWARAALGNPLWAACRKYHVAGQLSIKRHTAISAGDAAWYDEATAAADENNTFDELLLNGYDLAKSVTVSWKLKKMAVDDFIPYIEREIGIRMGVALDAAVYSGAGSASDEPKGIKTVLMADPEKKQVVEYASTAAITAELLRTAAAKIHGSYIKTSAVYANNKTVWVDLAAVEDGAGRSLFIADASVEGAVGRMFGLPVRPTESMADGEVLIGDVENGYVANIADDMTMHREDHVKARTTDYMGYSIVDGNVMDDMAFGFVSPTGA